MDALLIKYALRAKGHSIAAIARTCTNSVTGEPLAEKSVRAVIQRDSRSARIERLIGSLLGLPLHHVFPEWYAEDGSKIKHRRKRYSSTVDSLARLNAMLSEQQAA
jgi:lambda repressor-like predicted transcriptional regulator